MLGLKISKKSVYLPFNNTFSLNQLKNANIPNFYSIFVHLAFLRFFEICSIIIVS